MPLLTNKFRIPKESKWLLLLGAVIMLSACTQESLRQKTDVSFYIDSNTAQEILLLTGAQNSSRVAQAVTEENLQKSMVLVSLKGDYEESQTKPLSVDGVSFNFGDIPLGASIAAQTQIYYEDSNGIRVLVAEGQSSTIIVKEGENILSVELTISIDKKESDTPEKPELYEFYEIPVNDNWHFFAFNEYQDEMVTCKAATENSITFTLNRPLTQPDGMLQVVFGDKAYEKDKTYVCSYKIQGPVPDGATTATMNVCSWVTKEQDSTFSSYNNTSPAETSFSFTCDTSENGGLLFFPEIPGEYTISEVSVIEVDPFAQEITLCNLEIKVAEASAFEDIQVTVAEGSENIVFTAQEGFTSYSWQLKLMGKEIQTSNTNKLVIEAATLTKGNYYDLILFADNKSYTRQIKISE